MTTTVTAQIVLRKGTAAEWTTANPVLASGEIGFELVTKKTKIGDGVTAWNSLSYHYDPNDSGVGAAIAAHEAAANPHPVYLTQAEGDAAYAALGHAHSGVYEPASANLQAHLLRTDNPHAVTAAQVGADASGTATNAVAAHEAAANPHPVYLTQAEGDAAYAALGHVHTGVYEPSNANIQAHIARTDNPHNVTAAQVGADASGTATSAVAAHASATGVHAIAGVTGLQAALDGKSETTHNHTGIYDAAGTAASAVAAHAAGTGVHSIAGVTGLQTALDAKSATTHNHDAAYAPITQGVTNGNSHDHNGGDGGQIAYSSLSGLPSLGSAAAQNTTAFESSGAVATHAALTQAHGISAFFSGVVSAVNAAAALVALGIYNLAAKLTIQLSTEQLRLGYDSTNYVAFTVNSDGSITETVANAAGSTAWSLTPDGSIWIEVAGQTAGSTRGSGSLDIQSSRNAATKVASGANAIAIGANCTASGSNAVALGGSASATGVGSYALGSSCTSSGVYSASFGLGCQSSNYYSVSMGAYARNAIAAADAVSGSTTTYPGVHQMGRVPLGVISTDAAPAVLNIVSNSTIRPVLTAKNAWLFRCHLIAYTSTSTYRVSAWEITGVIARDGSNNTRIVGTPTVTNIADEIGVPAITASNIAADDTNEALQITVTGLAATTIRWTGGIYYTQAIAA